MSGIVPSPCASICRMQPGMGLCEGCLRTLDEIARWSTMDDDAKRLVWQHLRERRARLVDGAAPVSTEDRA